MGFECNWDSGFYLNTLWDLEGEGLPKILVYRLYMHMIFKGAPREHLFLIYVLSWPGICLAQSMLILHVCFLQQVLLASKWYFLKWAAMCTINCWPVIDPYNLKGQNSCHIFVFGSSTPWIPFSHSCFYVFGVEEEFNSGYLSSRYGLK